MGQGLEDNILRYTNSFVTHDDVPAQYMPLLFHGGVPMAFPAPTKSIRFPRLRDFNLSCSKRRYQVPEQSAAWYAACGTAFSNKPSHQTLGSVLRISYLTPCVTLSWLGVVGLKKTWDQKLSYGLLLTFKRNPAPCLVRQWIRVPASVPR